MKAVITIPLSSNDSIKALNSIINELSATERVSTKAKVIKEGLKLEVQASDITALKAGINTLLKLYEVHMEVKKCLN